MMFIPSLIIFLTAAPNYHDKTWPQSAIQLVTSKQEITKLWTILGINSPVLNHRIMGC